MIDVQYKVVFQGEILPGNNIDEVRKKLANLFRTDVKTVERMFSGKQHTIKSNVDQDNARKYAFALAKLGAMAYIEQEIVEYVEPVEITHDESNAFTETGSFDLDAISSFFKKQESKRAEAEITPDHEILSLDEIEEQQVATTNKDNLELTDVRKVLDPNQIATLLNKE